MKKDEVNLRIKQRLEEAKQYQIDSESDGTSDYSYWDGYANALDYVDDLLIILED